MNERTVLVVEDDVDSASILEAYLRKDGFSVVLAFDGVQAIQLFGQARPDIVLLDIMLPRVSGIDVLAAIRRSGDVPVIMVTAVGDEPEKLGALRYGADDYVVKPYNPKELVARVHAVLRRSTPTRPASGLLKHGRITVNQEAIIATVESPDGTSRTTLDLTPTEFLLLATLLRTPFKAFTRGELLDACLPGSNAIDRVVDTHMHNLRRKLLACGVSDVLVTVRSVGYRFQ